MQMITTLYYEFPYYLLVTYLTWLLHGKCTCSSKANRHFIIYKVAKKILMYKNLPPQVFWQPIAK